MSQVGGATTASSGGMNAVAQRFHGWLHERIDRRRDNHRMAARAATASGGSAVAVTGGSSTPGQAVALARERWLIGTATGGAAGASSAGGSSVAAWWGRSSAAGVDGRRTRASQTVELSGGTGWRLHRWRRFGRVVRPAPAAARRSRVFRASGGRAGMTPGKDASRARFRAESR